MILKCGGSPGCGMVCHSLLCMLEKILWGYYHFRGHSPSVILRSQHLLGHAVFQLNNRKGISINGVQLTLGDQWHWPKQNSEHAFIWPWIWHERPCSSWESGLWSCTLQFTSWPLYTITIWPWVGYLATLSLFLHLWKVHNKTTWWKIKHTPGLVRNMF